MLSAFVMMKIAPELLTSRRGFVTGVSTVLATTPVALALGACTTARDTAPAAEYALLDGSKVSTASLKGKVYIINFWATSCVTCVKEMPALMDTYQRFYAQGFDLVAVAMKYDPPAYVANFAETRKLPFKVALDNTGAVAAAFSEVKVTPTSYLIDRQGRIAKRWVGEPDFQRLHGEIAGLLKESA
jgi:peroxiredoxin